MGAILFLVPARGGSVRLPGKNLLAVAGMPLVGRAVRTARIAAAATPGGPHRVVCSTDDPAIAAMAGAWGAEVLRRPAALATSEASSVDVALHALDASANESPFEALVLLQPTSPLTEPADVVAAVARHRAADGAPVVSIVASHPAGWHHEMDAHDRLRPVSADGAWLPTGAIYVIAPDELRRSHRFIEAGRAVGHVMPPSRSVDIDEREDVIVAEAIVRSRPVTALTIGRWTIGRGRALIIAEAGVDHGGDVEMAHRLVDAAVAAGADAVAFQVSVRDPDRQGSMADEAWPALQAHARERGIEFLSTPVDDRSADLLDRLDVPAMRTGSSELANLPFVARVARFGRPMLVSTGRAGVTELAAAVDTAAENGAPGFALLPGTPMDADTLAEADLRAIEVIRLAFGTPVGWSDHTIGPEAALAAVALGATIVEKHLTLDHGSPDPARATSMSPDAFAGLVAGIRRVETALGRGPEVPVGPRSQALA